MKTFVTKAHEVKREWLLVDAKGKTLGRLATEIALRLRGKHKPTFSYDTDAGDYVVVINAAEITVTGNKAQDKIYYHHTGYPGGIKQATFTELQQRNPLAALEIAVKGMLPKGPLGRQMFRKLKVYAGSEHNHVAQQPKLVEFK